MDKLHELFKNPPAEFRGQPFWSWNAKLEKDELINQVKDMKEHGMGGFFMHSRDGLETDYMGEEWMECIKAVVEAASFEGMKAWLYDEDRWPSGNAGGLVVSKGGDKFKSKVIVLDIEDSYSPNSDVVAVFSAVLDGDNISRVKRLPVGESVLAEKPGAILVFRQEICIEEPCFNDNSPVDNLNPDAVALFIEETHEKYRKIVGNEFGKTVPGIFTDEASIAPGSVKSEKKRRYWNEGFDKRRVPWTNGFDEYFKEKMGYSFLDFVPYLFFDGEHSRKTRHDYWMLVAHRFVESFTKQISEWCEKYGIALTGHYGENDMGLYTWACGTAMGHYRYQQVPGIDVLCERIFENLGIKQATSVAHQFGREKVISETYGAAGWEFTFEGQKWMGDWQYVMGVNLRCQHLALYSIKGCRKRDIPPMYGPYAPWWKYIKVVEDYFARVAAVLTQGERVCDVLMIHPLTTAWSMLNDRTIRQVDTWSNKFNVLVRDIMGMHYDFDLGDETIIKDFGSVENSNFRVNKASYKLVIVPPLDTLLESTVELLKEFIENGGKVILMGDIPEMIEGCKDEQIEELFRHPAVIRIKGKNRLEQAIESVLPRTVSITDNTERQDYLFMHMERVCEKRRILFVANTDRKNDHKVKISLGYGGKIEEWDALNAKIKEITADEVDSEGRITINTSIGPAGSRLYMIDTSSPTVVEKDEPIMAKAASWFIGPECAFRRTWPNALVLDFCSFRINDEPWSEEMEVWQAQRRIRERLGMRQVYYNGTQQRYKWVNTPHTADGTHVEFRFRFNVTDVPENTVCFVVEDLEKYMYEINGKKVPAVKEGWYMENAFGKLKLPKLEEGDNEIVMSCGFKENMEVEDCFIIGNFGVDEGRNITTERKMIHFGDWCLQGYLHYSGSIVYCGEIDWNTSEDGDEIANSKMWDNSFRAGINEKSNRKVILTLGDYSAVTVEVRINGKHAGHIPWRSANGVDITPYFKQGKNSIEIEVMGSPRNLLGPLHRASGYEPFTESFSFRRVGSEFAPGYVLQPYGLFGQVRIDCYVW